ncbi:MAG: hypothetical protein HYY84_12010 [Deltaproteobacteria bacterium]|nr:hypothetical protein [Deltaproteobacteria bacterium]
MNESIPYRCPNAGTDGGDHVMRRAIDLAKVTFERDADANPFIRYREMLFAWHLARAVGKSDDEYVANARRLNDAVGDADGKRFAETPLIESATLCTAMGLPAGVRLFAKDETGNVAGSHKGRHLMGLGLSLAFAERAMLPWATALGGGEWRYAIASCGNAALAAAVVARALERALDVFMPVNANPFVVKRLGDLGLCASRAGDNARQAFHSSRWWCARECVCAGVFRGARDGDYCEGAANFCGANEGGVPARAGVRRGGGARSPSVSRGWGRGDRRSIALRGGASRGVHVAVGGGTEERRARDS